MASQFQNRLVGTVILVALVVIVLPALLDGHKKHYKDDFTAIPLAPKPGDSKDLEILPPVNQSLPVQPPEGAGEEIRAGNAAAPSLETVRQAVNDRIARDLPAPPGPEKNMAEKKNTTAPVSSLPVPSTDSAERDNILALFGDPPTKPVAEPKTTRTATPVGKAYVVQLGALKNTDKANDIVNKLRMAGYRVYTIPATPVAGKITRILIGPDPDREKLNAALNDLYRISGLTGVVKNYSVPE